MPQPRILPDVQLPDAQLYEQLDALSFLQEEVVVALQDADTLTSQWVFANYLDTAVFLTTEKRSALHRSVVHAVASFIEARLHDTPSIQDLSAQSWAYGDLVEAELQKQEMELNMDNEALVMEATGVLTRIAALELCGEFE